MALIKCKECGAEISKKAKKCVQCGAPQGPKQYSLGALILVVIAGVLIYSLLGNGNKLARASKVPPTKAEIIAAIKSSDDYSKHEKVFLQVSEKLIAEGKCTVVYLEEIGGWVKSTAHKDRDIYFTYCGEAHVSNRLYLDPKTGSVFK